ncbi:MAG: thiamine-phosphate kinase [Gemmatimonadota bacterium]|nr:thiamine-phosphate kinase [Gemmatimonadota bacterium]
METDVGAARCRDGKFDLIRAFVGEGEELPSGIVLGPGDDGAVLEGGWVISTDLAVEDVHFRRGWLTDEEIGYRAAAAALSDLAAMAAEPVGVLVSAAVATDGRVDVADVQSGVRAAAASVGARVIGGDLSRSPGPLFLDLVVLGRTERPVSRAGARPGDELWVSGTLGTGAAALRAWDRGEDPLPALRLRFARPVPRVALAGDLAAAGVPRAMVDLSDGLAGDAGHIAAASGAGIVIEETSVPVDPDARAVLGDAEALEAALRGGEDFELCFTAEPGTVEVETLQQRHSVRLTRVGRVTRDGGVLLEDAAGRRRPVDRGGYDHWSET